MPWIDIADDVRSTGGIGCESIPARDSEEWFISYEKYK
jgi:hypothetical protein